MKNEKIYQYILEEMLPVLQKHKVKLHLDFQNNHVDADGLACSGYFDDRGLLIACAVGTKKPEDWFGTLLHEFSHFEQWVEQCDAWKASQPEDFNSDELLDRFLAGEDFDNIEEVVKSIAFLEYDCEKRTTEKLDKFPEIFDVPTYIQKSNAYVAFYRKMLDERTWYDAENAPYLNEAIYKKMPSIFVDFKQYFEDFTFDYIEWDKCLPKKKEAS